MTRIVGEHINTLVVEQRGRLDATHNDGQQHADSPDSDAVSEALHVEPGCKAQHLETRT